MNLHLKMKVHRLTNDSELVAKALSIKLVIITNNNNNIIYN